MTTAPSNSDRVEAIEQLLLEKELIEPGQIDALIERFQNDVGPMVGTDLVVRAWTDGDFKRRLLADASAVLGELGVVSQNPEHLVVVENTPDVHNVVVCTLCSCYPWDVLGLPPAWYKDPSYRSRVVREPRQVLSEMGLDVPTGTDITVWDSSSEVRYMVLPMRPEGTDGFDEEQLQGLVNRDSMIGVSLPGTL